MGLWRAKYVDTVNSIADASLHKGRIFLNLVCEQTSMTLTAGVPGIADLILSQLQHAEYGSYLQVNESPDAACLYAALRAKRLNGRITDGRGLWASCDQRSESDGLPRLRSITYLYITMRTNPTTSSKTVAVKHLQKCFRAVDFPRL